jgi:hypothetical protein
MSVSYQGDQREIGVEKGLERTLVRSGRTLWEGRAVNHFRVLPSPSAWLCLLLANLVAVLLIVVLSHSRSCLSDRPVSSYLAAQLTGPTITASASPTQKPGASR